MARQSVRLKVNQAKSAKKEKPAKKAKPAKRAKSPEKKVVAKKAKKTKNGKKIGMKCTKCSKRFSKVSNLNAHYKKDHMGRRWECSECKEVQVSKYSHERHVREKHGLREYDAADQKEFYFGHFVQMSHKAKQATIVQLQEDLRNSENIIVIMKQKLKQLFSEIAELKANGELSPQQVESTANQQYQTFYEDNLKDFEKDAAVTSDNEVIVENDGEEKENVPEDEGGEMGSG